MTIEGKAKEDFDKVISRWKSQTSVSGVKKRLPYLLQKIGVKDKNVDNLRYQLFHRLASAVITAKKIFHWIHHRGAEVYICGNKRTMGKDVKDTLVKIVAAEGRLTQSEAEEYMHNLKANKRLKTDLY